MKLICEGFWKLAFEMNFWKWGKFLFFGGGKGIFPILDFFLLAVFSITNKSVSDCWQHTLQTLLFFWTLS